ncbi:MAG TPA: mechanosensitive ion channel domain-containing protein [Candidatus Limnocylindria bacterium]|jgi:small conductance mechanosensitive channel
MLPVVLPTWLAVLLIVLAAIAAYFAIRLGVRAAARHVLEQRGADSGEAVNPVELKRRVATLERLAVRVGAALVIVVATLSVLGEFSVEIGPIVAGLGVVGIAVGLGAQTLVKDWLAGIFIVIENQFSAGELVRIAGVEGVVEDFSLRRTTLRDIDGTIHTVPNGQIIVASNLSRGHEPAANVDATEPPEAPEGDIGQ